MNRRDSFFMASFNEVDWEQTQWMLKLTAIDKRAIARLNADLIPVEAFSTGLLDMLAESEKISGGVKKLLRSLHEGQQSHYDILWKYDNVFHKITGVKSPSPSNSIRNILAYAGMYIEEFDAIVAIWLLLMGHRLSTLYATLPLQRLGNIEPIYTSILQSAAVEKPLLYEIAMHYFKASKKQWSRDHLHRLGLIQMKFLETCVNQLGAEDSFLSLQHAVRHLGIDLHLDFSTWLAKIDRAPPLDLLMPSEDKIKSALKGIGASLKTIQIDPKITFS